VCYFILIFGVSFLICIITGFKLILECHDVSKESLSFTVLEYIYVFLLLIVSIFTMVVFLYSASFFLRLFYAQHPHIPVSNLKNKPNPQKIINRGDNSSLSTKEIQGMKEGDTSQVLGPSGR